jgi:hypothetical protein
MVPLAGPSMIHNIGSPSFSSEFRVLSSELTTNYPKLRTNTNALNLITFNGIALIPLPSGERGGRGGLVSKK